LSWDKIELTIFVILLYVIELTIRVSILYGLIGFN